MTFAGRNSRSTRECGVPNVQGSTFGVEFSLVAVEYIGELDLLSLRGIQSSFRALDEVSKRG
jgi:hypothetical protein